MRLTPFVLGVTLIVGSMASTLAAAEEPLIQPGYWESRNKMGVGPVTLSNKVERKCLTPKDVDKFMSGPSNRHYACDYPLRTFDHGKVVMSGQCVHRKKGTRIDIQLNGTYTPTSFDMKARLKWGMLVGAGTSTATRIGDACPAGSEIK